MIYIKSLNANLPVFQALSSEVRVDIIKLLSSTPGLNVKQISDILSIPMSTLSPHINKLKECGLITFHDIPASHGLQKLCYTSLDQIYIDFDVRSNTVPVYQAEIPIGNYSDFSVTPTCGLAASTSFLGRLDEPRYFAHPNRYQAGILWFTTGYVEYILPNLIPRQSRITKLSLSFEISSEAPKYNNQWPSDISFFLNGIPLGKWISPGDFGDKPGELNPKWWYSFINQYGLLKKITIDENGTWIDSVLLSSMTIQDFALTDQSILRFRMTVFPSSDNPRGLTLYGRGFGNHDQHILLSIHYDSKEKLDSMLPVHPPLV